MANYNCNCGCNCRSFTCSGISIVVSIILGLIAAFLRFSGTITIAPVALIVAFGIAVVFLAIALIGSAFVKDNDCVCQNSSAFLLGILGTIVTSLLLLAVTFAATSLAGAIVTAGLVASFSLIITSSICLVRCLSGCNQSNFI